eukprot:6193186-Pleurochrysis_carterae.AAC.1
MERESGQNGRRNREVERRDNKTAAPVTQPPLSLALAFQDSAYKTPPPLSLNSLPSLHPNHVPVQVPPNTKGVYASLDLHANRHPRACEIAAHRLRHQATNSKLERYLALARSHLCTSDERRSMYKNTILSIWSKVAEASLRPRIS